MNRVLIAAFLFCAFVFAGNASVSALDLPWKNEKATQPSTSNPPSNELPHEKDSVKEPSAKKAVSEKKAFKKQMAIGEVVAIDARANTITINKKGDVTTFTVDDTTTFRPEGKTFADVKAGDKVSVSYHVDGKNTAISIKLIM